VRPPNTTEQNHPNGYRSAPNSPKLVTSKVKREKSSITVSYQRKLTPFKNSTTNGDYSDDPDIIITRL